MSLVVDYLPVATGAGALVDSQANFASSNYQIAGFQNGIALPAQVNKCIRQSSVMSAALASFISTNLNISVVDDGNVAGLRASFQEAIITASGGSAASAQTTANTALADALAAQAAADAANAAIAAEVTRAENAEAAINSTNILGFLFSRTAQGYFKLPNWLGGFIIQWGFNACTANTTHTTAFPMAFPTTCLVVVGNVAQASGTGGGFSIWAEDNTQYNYYSSNNLDRTNWIAVGY